MGAQSIRDISRLDRPADKAAAPAMPQLGSRPAPLPANDGRPSTITAATLRVAAFSTLADLGVHDVGTQLPLVDLMTGWVASGLRADDLSAALNDCFADGTLGFHGDGAKSMVWLTSAGYAWLRSAWSSGEFVRQRHTLDLLKNRRRPSAADQRPVLRDRRGN